VTGDVAARLYTGPGGVPVELPRGDVTEGVVRVGTTVRRPHQPQSLAVAGYLDHLQRRGFDGAPRYLGRDGEGRDVLTFLPGAVAGDPPEEWAADPLLLRSVGALLRRLHEASDGYLVDTGFAAPPGSPWMLDRMREIDRATAPEAWELIAHNDVTTQNVVVTGGLATALVDFDLAGPALRLGDVYNTAMHWAPLRAPQDVWPAWRELAGFDQAARLRLLCDGYGLDAADRIALPQLGIARAEHTWRRMRAAATHFGGGWARMWEGGVGDLILRRRDWLERSRDTLLEALA
jgi:Ser/Thr protein kinase RdoA (MazF antagonist)